MLFLSLLLFANEIFSRASYEPCGNSRNWIIGANSGYDVIMANSPHPATFSVPVICTLTSTKSVLSIGETATVTLQGENKQGIKIEADSGSFSQPNGKGKVTSTCGDWDSNRAAPLGTGSATFTAPAVDGIVTIIGLCATKTGPVMVSNVLHLSVVIPIAGSPFTFSPVTYAPVTSAPTVVNETRSPSTAPSFLPTFSPSTRFPTYISSTSPSASPLSNSDGTGNSILPEPITDYLFWHIVTMIIGWGILIPVGIVIPLFNNIKHSRNSTALFGISGPTWLKYHWVLISIGCLFTFAGTVLGVLEVGIEPTIDHFVGEPHYSLGLFLLIVSVLQPLHGFLRPKKSKNPSIFRRFFDTGHPIFGYATALVGIAENIIGIEVMQRLSTDDGAPYEYLGLVGDTGFAGLMGIFILAISALFVVLFAIGLGRAFNNRFLVKRKVLNLKNKTLDENVGPAILLEEIKQHSSNTSCWVIYNDKVYDVTPFLQSHPGGKKSILNYAGKDMTKAFDDVGHSLESILMLPKYYVGEFHMERQRRKSITQQIAEYVPSNPFQNNSTESKNQYSAFVSHDAPVVSAAPIFLAGGSKHLSVALTEKIQISHNSFYLKFAFPDEPSKVLGLPIGKHIAIFAPNKFQGKVKGLWNNKPDVEEKKEEFSRKFTPVTCDENDVGYFALVVKMYRPCNEFPDGGRMSRYLENLVIGEQIEISGPFGSHEYVGLGRFIDSGQEILFKECGMICGGSGITPCAQIASAMVRNKLDTTNITILYSNTTMNDILMFDYLKDLQRRYPNRLRVFYTITKESGRDFMAGRITKKLLEEIDFPLGSSQSLAISCGPEGMMEVSKQLLMELGYKEDRIVEY